MDPFMIFWIFLIGIIVGVILGVTLLHRTAISPLHRKIDNLTSEKQALSTTYDMTTEQFAPTMEQYPYPTERFRFIGTPIDGIQFEDDQILFVKFRIHESKLNATQNRIKKLVKEGKVKWFEFKI